MPNRRTAIISALLGAGGLMLLAAAALFLPGVLLPVGQSGPPVSTATPLPAKSTPAAPSPQPTAAPNADRPPWPTLAPNVPALPVPVPTDLPPELSNPFCVQTRPGEPFCTPVAEWPTPAPPPVWPTPAPDMTPDQHGHADFGAWSYDYTVYWTDPDTYATVQYTGGAVAALQAYATANRQLAAQLAQTGGGVRVDITFRSYVAPDTFRAWARGHNLYVGWSAARILDEQGARQDFPVPMIQSDPYPQAWVDQTLAQHAEPQPTWPLSDQPVAPVQPLAGGSQPSTISTGATATAVAPPTANPAPPVSRDPSTVTVQGVFYVSAMADAKELPALVQDPLVFLVDVTPNIVRRQLLGQGVDVMHSGLGWVRVEPPSPFAQMEDLGLEHFR